MTPSPAMQSWIDALEVAADQRYFSTLLRPPGNASVGQLILWMAIRDHLHTMAYDANTPTR